MATKNYMINDKWLDLDKQNIVELQSVDGVLDSLKVNGSEIETPSGKITISENGTDIDVAQYALADVNVEGGGGSSDFSTAEVTVVNTAEDIEIHPYLPAIINNALTTNITVLESTSESFTVVLYKNSVVVEGPLGLDVETSGNASFDSDTNQLTITGDCTLTYSAGLLP